MLSYIPPFNLSLPFNFQAPCCLYFILVSYHSSLFLSFFVLQSLFPCVLISPLLVSYFSFCPSLLSYISFCLSVFPRFLPSLFNPYFLSFLMPFLLTLFILPPFLSAFPHFSSFHIYIPFLPRCIFHWRLLTWDQTGVKWLQLWDIESVYLIKV